MTKDELATELTAQVVQDIAHRLMGKDSPFAHGVTTPDRLWDRYTLFRALGLDTGKLVGSPSKTAEPVVTTEAKAPKKRKKQKPRRDKGIPTRTSLNDTERVVRNVLREQKDGWLAARQVRDVIAERMGADVSMSAVTVALLRLAKYGYIQRRPTTADERKEYLRRDGGKRYAQVVFRYPEAPDA